MHLQEISKQGEGCGKREDLANEAREAIARWLGDMRHRSHVKLRTSARFCYINRLSRTCQCLR